MKKSAFKDLDLKSSTYSFIRFKMQASIISPVSCKRNFISFPFVLSSARSLPIVLVQFEPCLRRQIDVCKDSDRGQGKENVVLDLKAKYM